MIGKEEYKETWCLKGLSGEEHKTDGRDLQYDCTDDHDLFI